MYRDQCVRRSECTEVSVYKDHKELRSRESHRRLHPWTSKEKYIGRHTSLPLMFLAQDCLVDEWDPGLYMYSKGSLATGMCN